MKFLSLLGSGPLVALLGHVVTGGIVYALAKGYVTPEALTGVATIGGLVVNAAASAARSTATAQAKGAAKAGLVAVPIETVQGGPAGDATWSNPNAR